MKTDELHADNSTKIYLDKINMLSNTYTPLTNFINKKDPILTEKFCTNYKKYRNLLSNFMKKSKQAHCDKYFERNWNNFKKTWKRIKSLTSLKTVASSVATVLSLDNGDTVTIPP